MSLSDPDNEQTSDMSVMTLRMTLTRLELRADTCLAATGTQESTKSLYLPSTHDSVEFWQQDTRDQKSVIKCDESSVGGRIETIWSTYRYLKWTSLIGFPSHQLHQWYL
jgi:hypothetical protein